LSRFDPDTGLLLPDPHPPGPDAAIGGAPASPPLDSGDVHDDDAKYIDDILTPDPDVNIQPVHESRRDNSAPIPHTTRILPSSGVVGLNIATPFMMYPADPRRRELHIIGAGSAATKRFAIADSPHAAQGYYASGQTWPSGTEFYSVEHTGPVWVYSGDTGEQFSVGGWSVTS
jgi:hypothetical protein